MLMGLCMKETVAEPLPVRGCTLLAALVGLLSADVIDAPLPDPLPACYMPVLSCCVWEWLLVVPLPLPAPLPVCWPAMPSVGFGVVGMPKKWSTSWTMK